jgi:carbon-monoxide dehydrogenase medium subunit
MIPGQLDYVRPGSLDEALRILRDREGEAKILSGGYSLIPLIKLRLAQPALLVDIAAIGGLDGISESDGQLRIGARATHRQIREHPIIVDHNPMLVETAAGIGDPQVRNWGTIGGSVAHADPSSDWPAVLLAINATIVCRGAGGDREIAARDFFLDTFTTAIEPTEVLVEIRLSSRPRGSGGCYSKLERKVGDYATVGVAAVMGLEADGTVNRAGIGVTGVSPSPYAATAAEQALLGQPAGDAAFRAAGAAAAAASEPVSDVRGSVDYKRAMVAELTVRSLRTAAERARAYA